MVLQLEEAGRFLGAAIFTFAATRLVMGVVWALRPTIRPDFAGVVACLLVTVVVFATPRGGGADDRAIRASLSPEQAYPGLSSTIMEARRQGRTDAEIHERIRKVEDDARAAGYTSEQIAEQLGQLSLVVRYAATMRTRAADVLTFYVPSLLMWLLFDLVRIRREKVWRPRIGRVLREGARSLMAGITSRRGSAVTVVLLGAALGVYGALSFEHELTGSVAAPIAVVTYPVWAKVAVVGGVVLVVAGAINIRRP
jgi:hypothetical protein